jgi:hypothetical protein
MHREGQVLGVERLDHRAGRPGRGEGAEQVLQGAAHPGVGVEHDLAAGVVGQAGGQRQCQLAALGLGQDPAAQPGADQVELSLGHGALEAEQKPVVEVARVIEPVLVQDERVVERADLQQPVPVGVVAGQPGAFQAEHDSGLAQRYLGDQVLEAFPVGG